MTHPGGDRNPNGRGLIAGKLGVTKRRTIRRLVRRHGTAMSARCFLLASALGLAACLPAYAGVYRWIDERGVVNYGDDPPQHARSLRSLDPAAANVNLIPGIPREQLEALRERDLQARLRRLEAEVDELRTRESERTAPPPPERSVYSTVPVSWTGWPRHRRPESGWIRHPSLPIARPLPHEHPARPADRVSSQGSRGQFTIKAPELTWPR